MTVITRLYETYPEARRALDQVNSLGLAGVEASILGNESISRHHEEYSAQNSITGAGPATVDVSEIPSGTATGAGIGAAVGGGAGLLAGLGMLAIPGIGPLVAAGWAAAAAVGAAGGALAGGAIGALADLGFSEADAPLYSEAIRRGNVMVSVRYPDEHAGAVEAALNTGAHASIDTLREQYQADGWRHDETEAEREARLRQTPPPPPFI